MSNSQRGLFFPGVGSQYVGMGKELYDTYRIVQEYFEEASDCLSLNMVKLCFASSDLEMMSLEHGAYALMLIETSSAALLAAEGILPTIVTSVDMVSWYSSVQSAGGISLPDSLYIVRKWLEAIQRSMSSMPVQSLNILKNDPEIAAMLIAYCEQAVQRGDHAELVAYYPEEIILAGTTPALQYIEGIIQRESIAYELSGSPATLHTSITQEIIKETEQYLEKIDFHEPRYPVFDPLRGGMSSDATALRATASRWFRQPTHIDLLPALLRAYTTMVSVIPTSSIAERMQALLPEQSWWYIDTQHDFKRACTALQTHHDAAATKHQE